MRRQTSATHCALRAMQAWSAMIPLLVAFSCQAAYVQTNLVPPNLDREFRGAWITTLNNITWPSKPGLPVAEQKRELLRILDVAAQVHLNALLFQVRPACDTFYESRLEPWSEYLTGEMGAPPAPWYDPLSFVVEEAHKRGLELHAWFNPFRARHFSGTNAPAPRHISKARPELVRKYGKDLWLDPGEQAVHDHTINVILDVVRRYDVDGVVVDDYFYPYKEKIVGKDGRSALLEFADDASWRKYRASAGKLTRDDWRRDNIDRFVQRAYAAVKAQKRHVKFGISPFGIWRPGFPESVRGLDAYTHLYADSRKWLMEGWVDYFAPQLYWPINATNQSFPVLLKWWAEQNVKDRHLWPGDTLTPLSTNRGPAEIINKILLTRAQSGASGNIHFNFGQLMRNTASITNALLAEAYAAPALVPGLPWLTNRVPAAAELQVAELSAGLRLTWRASDDSVRFWLLQTRAKGTWTSDLLPGRAEATVLKLFPEVIALSALDGFGTLSKPTVLGRTVSLNP